ncbi:unnamed protein product [Microthlaspi erraticum]|uniref:NYN domain-containing protein n=1 Tax=Microthlaspi erraticum TaxID=1685480 RepID=A0A6D2JMK9_9BRAS|nr:unnamed protein product [Microthlaspi erraticum]
MGDELCSHSLTYEEIDSETVVYWDVVDFPVTDIDSFNENIRLALGNAGYHGKVTIRAYYGDKKPDESAGITFVSRASKRDRMHNMLLDMNLWALDNVSSAPTNLMVITKMPDDDDEDETRFVIFLGDLNFECYNVLLALPDDYRPENMPFDLNFTSWRWSDLCAGGYPLEDSLVKSLRDEVDLRNENPQPPQPESQVICGCKN